MPDGAADLARCMELCAHCTCLLTTCLQKLSVNDWKKNNGPLITLQVWIPSRCHVWGATHEAILKYSSEAQTSFWIRSHTGKDMGQFSAVPINKVVPSFRNSLTEYWRVMKDILSIFLYSKSVTLPVYVLSLIVETIFLITSWLLDRQN